MSTKYQEYFQKMLVANPLAFSNFKDLHTNYQLDPERYQTEFNYQGEAILKIIHEWESKLCSHSEKSGYGNYSGNLAEKFQSEVRKAFPLIDHIGIIVNQKQFVLKKIKLP